MSFLNSFFGLLKKLALFALIVAITIPMHYRSTNPTYLGFRLLHSTLSLKNSLLPDQARPTLSADYRAFEDILRMKPESNRDPLSDPLPLVQKSRSEFLLTAIIPKLPHCQVNKEVFEHDGHTVDAYWVDDHQENLQKKADKILLYLHGGGYMAGSIRGKLFDIFAQRHTFILRQVIVQLNVICLSFSTLPFFIWNIVSLQNIHYPRLSTMQLRSIVHFSVIIFHLHK
jgi:hypothetical protein